ncbi:hypothetical protein [Pseudomonas putida]|uniref:hypothetical protein n=1 Tax=Pseudomonas putida TaxID=303 RepID=UPI001F191620|nr:hypothetical protein [Pseudomonas putida]
MSLEDVAKKSRVSRQTLHALLNQGKVTLINLVAVLRAVCELERLSSLLEEVRPVRCRSFVWKVKSASVLQVGGTFLRYQHPFVLTQKR